MLSVGAMAQFALHLGSQRRKAGNVHRYQDFADLTYLDFITSAAVIGPVLDHATSRPIGETVLEAIRGTRHVVATNTNLGIVLLLTPLASVPDSLELRSGLAQVLANLTVEDACRVYEAIRLAAPGGMGRVPKQDLADEPTQTLGEVMALAANRDLIARQYAQQFRDVLDIESRHWRSR